jgi:putative ABC transport system permease protein
MSQGVGLTMIGVMLGIAMALASTRLLGELLYEIDPRDPLTFMFAAAGLLVVAIVACWVPARRALRVDPIGALRYE